MTLRVEADTERLERAMRQLATGLERQPALVGARQASRTAADIRAKVPRRSGRLASTVGTVHESNGAGVTYGGGLPYAHYIEGRSHAVAEGISGTELRFRLAMEDAAREEIGRL